MTAEIYRVLLIDDDEDDYIVADDYLKEAQRVVFKLTWVDNYQDGLATIAKNQHDAYLLDYRLGKENGLELLRESLKLGCRKPIILLTGVGDHEIDREAMAVGASDYLVKGKTMNGPLLERAILHAMERKQAEIRQTELVEQLAYINQELEDFAHIVSHDLKAPLRGIISLTDWLEQDYGPRLDENGREMLQLIGERVRRMSDLIDGVLQYSRMGKLGEKKEQVELNTLVAGVINALNPPKGIKITIETDLPTVWVGRSRIQQVFQNLISNAVKYMGRREGEVRMGHTSLDGEWQFYVADTGLGIERRHFERIFQIFQTLTSPDRAESSGVGLAIVKKIVENYGGSVWVTSKIGQGSNFFFTLPKTPVEGQGQAPDFNNF